jgi:hypothetical protein
VREERLLRRRRRGGGSWSRRPGARQEVAWSTLPAFSSPAGALLLTSQRATMPPCTASAATAKKQSSTGMTLRKSGPRYARCSHVDGISTSCHVNRFRRDTRRAAGVSGSNGPMGRLSSSPIRGHPESLQDGPGMIRGPRSEAASLSRPVSIERERSARQPPGSCRSDRRVGTLARASAPTSTSGRVSREPLGRALA